MYTNNFDQVPTLEYLTLKYILQNKPLGDTYFCSLKHLFLLKHVECELFMKS